MEEKNNKKKIIPIAGLVLAAIFVLSLGSYAYWQLTKKQTNRNVVGTACLKLNFGNESGDIDLGNAWPISDSEGAQTDPYTFTITNQCDTPVNYIVGLESIADPSVNYDDYLNYDYLRVKLDGGMAKSYGSLETLPNDTEEYSYTIRDTKEIVHHTLGANESVTHSLRLWLYENTPLQNEDESYNTEKYFYGKIKIIAGQNINGDEPITIGVVSGDVNTAGSEVRIGDEYFYVLGDDEENSDNVKLLAKYNLLVGESRYLDESIRNEQNCESAGYEWDDGLCYASESYTSSTSGYNRQSSSVGLFNYDMVKYVTYRSADQSLCESYGGVFDSEDSDCKFTTKESNTTYDNISELGEPDIDTIGNDAILETSGAVNFAESTYWLDNGNIKADYSVQENQFFPYVYYNNNKIIDSDNTISTYVNNYKDILESEYRISVADARLLNTEESIFQFCEIDEDLDCSSAPSWLFSSSYWLGSLNMDSNDELYVILNVDDMPLITASVEDEIVGVRPVITVSKTIFN